MDKSKKIIRWFWEFIILPIIALFIMLLIAIGVLYAMLFGLIFLIQVPNMVADLFGYDLDKTLYYPSLVGYGCEGTSGPIFANFESDFPKCDRIEPYWGEKLQ